MLNYGTRVSLVTEDDGDIGTNIVVTSVILKQLEVAKGYRIGSQAPDSLFPVGGSGGKCCPPCSFAPQ